MNDDELDRVDVKRRAVLGATAAAGAIGALSMAGAADAATQGLRINGGVADVETRANAIRRDQPEAAAMLSTLASQLRGRSGINKISFGLNIKW